MPQLTPSARRRPARPGVAPLALPALLLATVLTLVAGCATPDEGAPEPGGDATALPAPAVDPGAGARLWVTSPTDPSRRLTRTDPVAGPGPATAEIDVDPGDRRQRWWGTGAALTDASRQLLARHPAAARLLFAAHRPDGARLNLLRLPLTATDLSPRTWAWDWDGSQATPPRPARRAVRMVTRSLAGLAPDLRVVATPWSAPAAMKTSGSLRGGALLDRAVPDYARMLVSQAQWLAHRGVPLWAMTLGNEPGYSTDYATMTMTDEQMTRLGEAAGPRLGAGGVHLWALDHNWADRPRADTVLGAAPGAFDGVAFHCYGGTPDQMAGLPVPSLVSECTGTTDGWSGTFGWDARTLVADAVSAGSSGLMMWSLALDADHGPVDAGSQWGCKDCRGLVTVDGDQVRPEPELYTLAHLSRAASPGARVIASSATPGLSAAAFRNRDGSIGVFGQNATGATRTVAIRITGRIDLSYTVAPGEMFTFRSAAA
ncbi:glycoside hydrolase family 30 protein [Nocardioides sp. MAHUQ-72]|uniref:glycoside hydrolase family 30 protein n=1 Tax=unclassified Nocardioides TaxID=2615069 RepID=UPI0036223B75